MNACSTPRARQEDANLPLGIGRSHALGCGLGCPRIGLLSGTSVAEIPAATREKTIGHHLLSRRLLSIYRVPGTVWARGRTHHWLPWFNLQKSMWYRPPEKVKARRTVWCSRPAWGTHWVPGQPHQHRETVNNNNEKSQCAR